MTHFELHLYWFVENELIFIWNGTHMFAVPVSGFNKGWIFVNVSSQREKSAADSLTEKPNLNNLKAWCLISFSVGLSPPVSSLFLCLFPRRPLKIVLTLILLDWFPGSDAGWPELTGRAVERLAHTQGPYSPEGWRTDGWMDGSPSDLLSARADSRGGGRVWIVLQTHTHQITISISLFLSDLLFCWGDNVTHTHERAHGHEEEKQCPKFSHCRLSDSGH